MAEADRGTDPPESRPHPDHPLDLGLERVIFLSDGVFASAMSLLVIALRIPEIAAATSDQVIEALRELGPRIFAYALSFTIIGFYWIAHWRRFKLIDRADLGLAYLNLMLLAFIAFIPFPTALIGEHGDLPISVVIYAVTLSAAGLLGFATWLYAIRADLVMAGAPRDLVRSGAVRGLAVPLVMIGSLLLLPFVSTSVVEISWLLVLPAQALLARRARQAD
jgi:uncharacterized membrane protein